jgi:hypothetical protein
MLRWDAPYLALSKARSGDLPGARALVDLTPHDCYRCNLARGEIAAIARQSGWHARQSGWQVFDRSICEVFGSDLTG